MATANDQVSRDRDRLYSILLDLESRVGKRLLRDCHGRLNWPKRGVYFFFEDGECRQDGQTPRVVRVGTHAISERSRTTLWNRLSQHRGTQAGGGNHRGSVFRRHVGRALLTRGDVSLTPDTWGQGSTAKRPTTDVEKSVERTVSAYIGSMPFLWVAANDEPSRSCDRSLLETNSIGLLSRLSPSGAFADAASATWLGRQAAAQAVRDSHLWNVRDANETYDPGFLDLLERCARNTEAL